MYRIYRIIGKKGRITIPYEMRSALNIGRGDILSFQLNGKSVVATIKEDVPAMPAGGAGGMGMM